MTACYQHTATWWSTSATASRSRRTGPTSSSFRARTEQVQPIVRLCNEYDVPFLPRGAGTSLAGGCLPVGGGVVIVLTRMKRDSRDRPPRSLRRGRAGRGQRLAHAGPGRHRLSLRPRPVEPGGLHHRRQRGHQRRRPAHAQVRRDRQSRARRRGRAGRRLDRRSSAARSRTPPGSI